MKCNYDKIVTAAIFSVSFYGSVYSLLLTIFLTLYTPLRWFVFLYIIWIYLYDIDTPNRGGRRYKFLRNSSLWNYCENYVQYKLETVPGVTLKPNRNYLFACFPHGVFCLSIVMSLLVEKIFKRRFSLHKPHSTLLSLGFKIPFFREYLMGLGICSSSAKSLRYLLGNPNGGNVAGLFVGGAQEAFYCRPGNYHIVLKNRKGFIKIALQCGSPIVPVFGFGEINTFDQIGGNGSSIFKIQQWMKNCTGFAPIIPMGCGFFQNYFGLIPRKTRLTTLVGMPIEVEKVDHPTQEQINELHKTFMESITLLFEENKHKYIDNAENVSLIIE